MDKIFNKSLLGLNIKYLRLKSGLTQSGLSVILGVKSTALSNWEVGISSPDMETLAKISNHFGISLDQLAFTSHSNWLEIDNSASNDKLVSSQLPSNGGCEQCAIRDKLIAKQEENIDLLKDKIAELNRQLRDKGKSDNIKQTA